MRIRGHNIPDGHIPLKPTSTWWMNLLKIITVLYVLTCLLVCIPGATINVEAGVPGDHDAIIQEVLDALEFVRVAEKLDERTWVQGLRIDITESHLGPCGDGCTIIGVYWHYYNKIQVMWGKGTCSNALIHELYHRVSYFQGHHDGVFGEESPWDNHGEKFKNALKDPQEEWRRKRGCPNAIP